jgi:hypothetical protein
MMALAASSVTARAASSAKSPAPQSCSVATVKWRAAAGPSREKANVRTARGPEAAAGPMTSSCRRHTSAKASISRVTEPAR